MEAVGIIVLAGIAFVVIAFVLAVTLVLSLTNSKRRSNAAENRSEVALLRAEVERLREEVELLKKGLADRRPLSPPETSIKSTDP